MTGGGTLLLCIIAIAAGVLSLRVGWGRPRGRHFVGIGWAAILAGVAVLAARDGAWGLSVGALAAMLTACLVLAHSALVSAAPAKERAARTATPSVLLRSGGAEGLLRRLAVFILVIPVAFGVSVMVALAFQAAARSTGWLEPDSTALGLLVFPIVWTILATMLMLRPGPISMLKPLAGTLAAAGASFWIFI